MRFKNYRNITIISLLVCIIISPLGSYGGHHIKFSVVLIVYCLLTYFYLIKTQNNKEKFLVVFSLSLPILILLGGAHIILFKSTIWSLPSSIAHILGILAGFIIYQVKLIYKITLGLILIIFSIWVTLYGFTEYWLQRVYFGTLSGNVIEKVPLHSFKDQRGELVTLSNLGNKLIILDFWHTKCGACFRKFPELQENYLKYKQDPDVNFYAVNIPNERDTLDQATKMLEEIGYKFPVIIAESNNLADSFNIHVYPTVIIINEGKEIIYRGSIGKVNRVINKMKNGH